jgi:hypothetical protein
MDNYSVFANVMFVFMRRQMKLNIWASYVESIVSHKPLAIFIFNLRYKQLAAMIDSDTSVYYKVPSNYSLLKIDFLGPIFRNQKEQHEELALQERAH